MLKNNNTFKYPVSQLLNYGEYEPSGKGYDYSELGIGSDDIPELINLATNFNLLVEHIDDALSWAPIHAMRILGQLKATEAIEPLIDILKYIDIDNMDWLISELPPIFEQIGKASVPQLMEYVRDIDNTLYPRLTALDSIIQIAKADDSCKEDCVKYLRGRIKKYKNEDAIINGKVIDGLVAFKDMESIDIIKAAFDSDSVNFGFAGDWQEVQIRLGLLTERISPPKVHEYPNSDFLFEKPTMKRVRNRKDKMRKKKKKM